MQTVDTPSARVQPAVEQEDRRALCTASTAFSNVTVLDLTRSGQTCARQLADWGADVIRVEIPAAIEAGDAPGGPRHGPDFQNLHRNKRSLSLDLKAPEGREILLRLVEKADVLIENFRPDVKSRLGIDYETMREVNRRLVYASISGFGQDGPYVQRPGFDHIAQGMGGLMSITGLPGQGSVRVGIPIADLTAGLFTANGILIALLERSGEGQWVHSSLLQAQIAILDFQPARWLMDGEVAQQAGNDHPTSIPTGVFPTSDGHINIAATGQRIWERLCRAIGAEGLAGDPRFVDAASRSANRKALNAAIGERTAVKPSGEWVEIFNAAGVPCGPIYTIDQVFADPQVRHLGMSWSVDSPALGRRIDLVAQPIRMSRSESGIAVPPPECGEQTDEILGEAGYSATEIAGLRDAGVV